MCKNVYNLYWVDIDNAIVIRNSPSLKSSQIKGKVLVSARHMRYALHTALDTYSISDINSLYYAKPRT